MLFLLLSTAPALAVVPGILTPSDGSTWNSGFLVEFRYNTTDILDDNCTLVMDGLDEEMEKTLAIGPTQSFYEVAANGAHTWLVTCQDNVGNESSASAAFTVAASSNNSLTLIGLGQAGFEETNPEVTGLRTVIADAVFNDSATLCSYKNLATAWSTPQPCVDQIYWLISDFDGLKTVWIRVNHSDVTLGYAYDTITLSKRGYGLDTSAPIAPTIFDDGDYTNDNTSFYFRWEGGYDRESDLLRLPLQYAFTIPGTNYSLWYNITGLSELTVPINEEENDNISVQIRVTNSAGLTNTSESDGITIDLTGPVLDGGEVTSDISGSWTSSDSFTYEWLDAYSDGSEGSGVYAYSFTLSTQTTTSPDQVPEGTVGNLSAKTNHSFTGLTSGTYYFHLRARDEAGNWADTADVYHGNPILIDVTRPSIPELKTGIKNATSNTVRFNWTRASDSHSGVAGYFMELATDQLYTQDYLNYTTGNVTSYEASVPRDAKWYARVRAFDSVGNNGYFSDLFGKTIDVTPPQFVFQRPSGTVVESPKLVIETNEQATCTYDGNDFAHTNSTYHETSPGYAVGPQNITVICTDASGLSNSTQIQFDYQIMPVTSVVVTAPYYVFTNRPAYVNVQVLSGVTPIGEVSKGRWSFSLGAGTTSYQLQDMAGGDYRISLVSPPNPGQYLLNLSVDSISPGAEYLNVSELTLKLSFSDTGIAPSNMRFISQSSYNGMTLGFATDTRRNSLESVVGTLALGFDSERGRGYIIVTHANPELSGKEDYLEQARFFELVNPTFGYPISDKNLVRAVLSYPDIVLLGHKRLPSGKYTMILRNAGLDEFDRSQIDISVI